MINFRLLSKLTIIAALFFTPLSAGAAEVPWSYEWYRAYAYGASYLHFDVFDEATDEATGPVPPLNAEVTDADDFFFHGRSNIESSYMETLAGAKGTGHFGGGAYASAEFWGRYTADMPFFVISYDYDYSIYDPDSGPLSEAWLKIDDLTEPGNLFDGTFALSPDATGSGVLYIPIPVGHELEVYFGISSLAPSESTSYSTYSQLALNYNMAVTPEPVSSLLFLAGGATLAMRYYRKKRKKALENKFTVPTI
ncbi:MAG: hypothetical protein GXP46_06045 [Deferribacteres bacterium]|nr:hypothetical protein [Deferribacteres bacterium]